MKLAKNIRNNLEKFAKESVKKDFYNRLKKSFIPALVDFIKKGISPVDGFRRFQKYSDSYKKSFKYIQGKKKSPVNMTRTGEMLESFYLMEEKSKLFLRIRGNRNNKLVDIHNRQGASKKKIVRRLLPTNEGEKFNNRLQLNMSRTLKESSKYSITRLLPKNIFKIKINTNK